MGCCRRNMSQSLRWDSAEWYDPSSIKVEVFWKWNGTRSWKFHVFCIKFFLLHSNPMKTDSYWSFLLCPRLILSLLSITTWQVSKNALKPHYGDSCAFVLTAESIIPFLFFIIKGCISSHYIKFNVLGLFMWCTVSICYPLSQLAAPFHDDYVCTVWGHTPSLPGLPQPRRCGAFKAASWLQTEISGEIGWASVTTDKPSTVLGYVQEGSGDHCGQTGWRVSISSLSLQLFTRRRSHLSRNFTPYWQCGFCQLLLQQSLTTAHPSVSSLLPSLSLPALF